jgi:two-component system sensor histidine kinase/response regulator
VLGGIRHRLESEAALQQRFEYVVRATNDAVWDINLATHELRCGERFYETFGYKADEIELTAAWWLDCVHPDDRERVSRNMNAAVESGDEHWSSEYHFRRADGSYANVYDRGYILRDPTRKPLRMIGALMDISTLTGIGISADKQSAIFDAFTQADGSTARRYGGTGLGLTISRRLVELMGGRIWLDSENGRGSTFHFLARFSVGRPAPESELAGPADLCGIPVMVVDDNATNRRILGDMLRQWQMAPVLAASGREALDELEAAAKGGKPFSLVLTDASMPDMDGLELVKQIRQRPHLGHVKIIVLTSAGRWCDTGGCPGLGLETCLSKPVGQSELRNAILGAVCTPGATTGRGGPSRCPVKHRTRNLRILVAEDNVVNQKLARRLLEKQGHGVAIAGNGREAVEAIQKDAFDLVLMDVQMPEMDGFVATRTIRQSEAGTGRHLPIIAMTAHAMKGDEERCLEAGMDGYVSKPINATQLLAVIDETANLSVV